MRTPRTTSEIAEDQIRKWQAEQRDKPGNGIASCDDMTVPGVVTLSAQVGLPRKEVPCLVGEILGVPVFDREIVEHIARRRHLRTQTVETLDENVRSRMEDWISSIFRESAYDQSDYLHDLIRTVTAMQEHGPCVIVGHGANRILPPGRTFSARLVSPLPDLIRRMVRERGIGERAARQRLEEESRRRRSFIHDAFGGDVRDPLSYDLLINTARVPSERAASLIAEGFRRKFGARRDVPAKSAA
jgi:cytidylate kinase